MEKCRSFEIIAALLVKKQISFNL